MAKYWRRYVPVAARQVHAARAVKAMRGGNQDVQPVVLDGRQIAFTFWGQAWCDHLEQFSDYENRLPRGRSYVRNGSVCHLEIAEGVVRAMVMGSYMYDVTVKIDPLPAPQWRDLKIRCAGQIGSLLELLQGRLSDRVMAEVCDLDRGLFPQPPQIHLTCSCPDWAVMCKHVAAVLYGVGARLDEQPQLLFVLRGVNHEALLGAEAGRVVTTKADSDGRRRIAQQDLGDVFGIDLSLEVAAAKGEGQRRVRPKKGGTRKAESGARKVKRQVGKSVSAGKGAPTGAEVARLRARFRLSQKEFGLLLDVSGVTVSNWERSRGTLRLPKRVQDLWPDVLQLTIEEASICLELLSL